MSFWTHFMGITSSIRGRYSIYLPVHCRRIKSLLFWDGTPFWDFFCRLKTVPLDNGTFNSSNTDVVEKVNFWVAA